MSSFVDKVISELKEIEKESPITHLSIDQKFSDEKGEFSETFYFRLEKESKMAKDENGDFAPAYCQIKLEAKQPIDFDHWQKLNAEEIARSQECDIQYIVPISKEEYDQNAG